MYYKDYYTYVNRLQITIQIEKNKVDKALSSVKSSLTEIKSQVFMVLQYYYSKKEKLSLVATETNRLEDSWDTFVSTLVGKNSCEFDKELFEENTFKTFVHETDTLIDELHNMM